MGLIVEARATAEKARAFFLSRWSSRTSLRLFSRAASASRSAKVAFGFGGDAVGGFQGFLRETWLAFFPRSIPSTTLCGDIGATGFSTRE